MVCDPALLELCLAVATVLAVSLSVVEGDHEVFLEGTAAALHVKVEHFVEVLELVVQLAHITGAQLSLCAQGTGVRRHRNRLRLWPPVPNFLLPFTPSTECITVVKITRYRCILEILLPIHSVSDLTEPLVDPGHLVTPNHLVEQELRQLSLAILVLQPRSLGHLLIERLPLHGPVRLDDPLSMSQLHITKLSGHLFRSVLEVHCQDVALQDVVPHVVATETALDVTVAIDRLHGGRLGFWGFESIICEIGDLQEKKRAV